MLYLEVVVQSTRARAKRRLLPSPSFTLKSGPALQATTKTTASATTITTTAAATTITTTAVTATITTTTATTIQQYQKQQQ